MFEHVFLIEPQIGSQIIYRITIQLKMDFLYVACCYNKERIPPISPRRIARITRPVKPAQIPNQCSPQSATFDIAQCSALRILPTDNPPFVALSAPRDYTKAPDTFVPGAFKKCRFNPS
jgi:hypothetical protein